GISHAAQAILHAAGYPVTKNGLVLNMGSNEIYMGAPCSGFRSLITMLALAVGYTHAVKMAIPKRLILIASAIPLALIGNLLRVMVLCLITFYAGKHAAEGFWHYVSGGIIFLMTVGCFLGLEYLLERK